jgi:hypothetical protein
MDYRHVSSCPFCGNAPKVLAEGSRYFIKCPSCSLVFGYEEGAGAVFKDMALLIDLWNTRKSSKKKTDRPHRYVSYMKG